MQNFARLERILTIDAFVKKPLYFMLNYATQNLNN